MRSLFCFWGLLAVIFPIVALADGFPFEGGAHEVVGNSLQLALSEEQVTEVSSTGKLTFSVEQHALLKKFYVNAPEKIRVISSTFNDGLDIREPNPVDCIWTSPNYVGITLRKQHEKGSYSFTTEADSFPTLRVSPKGDIYSGGNEITMEAAIKLIRGAKRAVGSDGPPFVAVTLPPPYREPRKAKINAVVIKLFQQLVESGREAGVVVHRSW